MLNGHDTIYCCFDFGNYYYWQNKFVCKIRERSKKKLFAQSKNISDQQFHNHKLDGLPESVQRYFKHTLKDGQPYIIYARIKHVGQFKTGIDKDWINIKGEQYATTEKPGFI